MPPRPRPRPRAMPTSPVSSAPSDASNPSARLKRSKKEIDDEDAMFIRNKGRSLREVNKRAERAAALAPQTSSSLDSDDEGEDDEEETPKQRLGKNRKHNTFSAGKAKALPKWAKKGAIRNLLGNSDSESENNHPSTYDGTPSKRRRGGPSGSNAGTSTGKHSKRPRTRSRSRSLTPPPEMPLTTKLRVQQAIQHALNIEHGVGVRSVSPEAELGGDGEDAGTSGLDPELQYIVQTIRERAMKRKAVDDDTGQGSRPVLAHKPSGGPPDVTVRVKWVSHPEDDAMYGLPQMTWTFITKRHDTLKELFLQTADKAHVLSEDLMLMRDNKQVFTSVSPEGLGVWDQVDLEACDRATFEALRSRHFRSPTPAQRDANNSDDETSALGGSLSQAHDATSVEPGDSENRFKLVLRARGSKEVTLVVRPTTTCGKIIRAFLRIVAKQGGTVPASPRKVAQVCLCIDGEKQDPDTSIADCDLEDGDMVEVAGM